MYRNHVRLAALALAAALLSGCAGPGGPGDGSSTGGGVQSVGPSVRVDWSKLEERPEPLPAVGGRRFQEYMDDLVPRTDYGPLVPFVGNRVATILPEEMAQETGEASFPNFLHGLMTREGDVVMDAVCTYIFTPSYTDEMGETHSLPAFLLERGVPGAGKGEDGRLLAAAAQDGSWCTPTQYWGGCATPRGLLLGDGAGLTLLDTGTGAALERWTWAQLGVSDPNLVFWNSVDAYDAVLWTRWGVSLGARDSTYGEILLLDLDTGAVSALPSQEWYQRLEQWFSVRDWWDITLEDGRAVLVQGQERYELPLPFPTQYSPYVVGTGPDARVMFSAYEPDRAAAYTLDGREVVPPQEGALSTLGEWEHPQYLALRPTDGQELLLLDWEGRPLCALPLEQEQYASLTGGLVEIVTEDVASYYQPETGKCVFRTYLALEG